MPGAGTLLTAAPDSPICMQVTLASAAVHALLSAQMGAQPIAKQEEEVYNFSKNRGTGVDCLFHFAHTAPHTGKKGGGIDTMRETTNYRRAIRG